MSRAVLFIQTDDSPSARLSREHLLAGLEGSRVWFAKPAPSHFEPKGAPVEHATVHYPAERGVAGALAAFAHFDHDGAALADADELVVISDLVLGPLGTLPDPLAADAGFVQTMVPTEARETYTESPALATAEKAGPLAMEVTWLQIPTGLWSSAKFQGVLARAAESTHTGATDWLALDVFSDALGESGIRTVPLFSPRMGRQDFFGRSLPDYLAAGVQLLPWALFTTDPVYLERWAIVPRTAWDYAMDAGYPADAFWERVLHACPPQTWYTNLALLDIYPDSRPADFTNDLQTAVIAHVFYPEMLGEILDYAGHVPDPVKLFVTTDTEKKKEDLRAQLQAQSRFENWEVRVVQTNRGRDISAFLLDCADVLTDQRFDMVVKLHSKLSAQDPSSVSGWFREHLFQNLLGTPGFAAHIWEQFSQDDMLGMVFPPVIHMGVPTMGNGWTLNREPAQKLAPRLGIDIPFDSVTPLSPYGSMFIARRKALEPLVQAAFEVREFPDAEGYRDGSVAHTLERLFSYVVYSEGYYSRCTQRAQMAQISATALQYKYDQISHYLFPFAQRQLKMLGADRGALSGAELRSLVQRQLSARYPRVGRAALGTWLRAKSLLGRVTGKR